MVKIQECAPINKQAAAGISHKEYDVIGRSQHAYLSKKRVVYECPSVGKAPPKFGSDDLTGKRNGRIVVMGWCSPMENYRVFGSSKPLKYVGGAWVVRCDCGKYERRKRRQIMHPIKKEYVDACTFCRGAWAEAAKSQFIQTGVKPEGGLPTHKASTLLTQPKDIR